MLSVAEKHQALEIHAGRDVESLTRGGGSSGSLRNRGRGGDAFHDLPSTQTKSEHLSLGWALWLVSSSNEGIGF